MTAAAKAASDAIRRGQAPGLAIFLAAKAYNTTTKAVVKAMRTEKKPIAPAVDTSNAWWNK